MSMYPGFSQRRPPERGRPRAASASERRPGALTVAYWLCLLGAVATLFSGLVLLTTDTSTIQEAARRELVEANKLGMGWFNIGGGIVVAAVAPRLIRGTRIGRRWVALAVTAVIVGNVLALATQVMGPAVVITVLLFAFGLLAMFRPAANGYFAELAAEGGSTARPDGSGVR